MKNVEFFDWKLNFKCPLSWSIVSQDRITERRRIDIHSAIHLLFVLEGTHRGRCGNAELVLPAGSVFLNAPWEPHGTLPGEAKKILLINLDPDALKRFFFAGFDRVEELFHMPAPERLALLNGVKELPGIREELLQALRKEDPLQPLRVWHAAMRLFLSCELPPSAPSAPTDSYQRLLPALRELGGKLLSTEEAASLCSLSVSRFSVIFKNVFGVNFARYERLFRLDGAEEAIRQGATLKEAASDWGFCDKSHLARLLKSSARRYGR